MTEPLVSICIPTYNRANFIAKAIDSALGQTYKNIEVIVVDNASTDNTEKIVKAYDDPRLKYVRNSENLGLFGNFNRCIELYNGDFLHILHSDEYIEPNFTEKCIRFFEEHQNVQLTCTSYREEYNDHILPYKLFPNDMIFTAPNGFKRILSEGLFISCASVMVRRGVYESPDVGKFSLEYPFSGDLYQWLKITKHYDVAYLSDVWMNDICGEYSESYRLLFNTPIGYMDTLKIHTNLIHYLDAKKEFVQEINQSLIRYIKDCYYAIFARAGKKSFCQGILCGLAYSACALMQVNSGSSLMKKWIYTIMTFFVAITCHIPGLRRIIKYWLTKEKVIPY